MALKLGYVTTYANEMPQSMAHLRRLPPPSADCGPETRLPGVRQLLQQHSAVGSNLGPLAPRHLLDEHVESTTPITPSSSLGFAPLSKECSENSISTLHLDGVNPSRWTTQPMARFNINPREAADVSTTQFVQVSPQEPGQIFDLQEDSHSSPHVHRYDPLGPVEYTFPQIDHGMNDVSMARGFRLSSKLRDKADDDAGQHRPYPGDDLPSHFDWGKTKAGKPRKRLAQACLSCRQKKIRCHPTPYQTKCDQCERSDVDCRFENG